MGMSLRRLSAIILSIVILLSLTACGSGELPGVTFEVGQSIQAGNAKLTLTEISGFQKDYDINNDGLMDGDFKDGYVYVLVIYEPENLSGEVIEGWEPTNDVTIVYNGKRVYTAIKTLYYYPYMYTYDMKSKGWWMNYQIPTNDEASIPTKLCKVFQVSYAEIKDAKPLQLKIRLNNDDTDYLCEVRKPD